MTSASTDPAASGAPASAAGDNGAALHGHVCPFCGLTREITIDFDAATPCPRCTLADTPTTRNATRARVGPWHVRQVRNPWAPGMRFETLLALIKRGQVTRDSIVRGPTTHQLWKRAAEIKGLSREFGLCYSCGGEIEAAGNLCPHCNRLQEPPVNPDVLIETREGGAPSPPKGSRHPTRRPVPPIPSTVPVEQAAGEEIQAGHSASATDPTDLLAVTEEQAALARSITSRPPQQPPARPSRPLTIRPRTPGADDALLTPQELAAAFQLDFSPPQEPARRRGSKVLVMLLLLLLIGGGVAALFYVRPDLREQATAWGERTYESAKTFIATRTNPGAGNGASPSPATRPGGGTLVQTPPPAINVTPSEPVVVSPPPAPRSRRTEVADSPRPAPAVSSPVATKPAEPLAPPAKIDVAIAPPPVRTAPPAPATNRTADGSSAAVAAANEASNNAPPEPPVANPAPPAPPAPAPVKQAEVTLGDPYLQSRLLYIRAIEAEGNGDYVEAVNCYEQIKKLPPEFHHGDLDVRLKRARQLSP